MQDLYLSVIDMSTLKLLLFDEQLRGLHLL